MTYTGSQYGFIIVRETVGSDYVLTISWNTLSPVSSLTFGYRAVGSVGAWTETLISTTSPDTVTIPIGNYEYRVIRAFGSVTVTFTLNYSITFPELNPIIFFSTDRAATSQYLTKHFVKFPFEERLYDWQSPEEYCWIWQTTDSIIFHFESTFESVTVKLLDENDGTVITQAGITGIENVDLAGTFYYRVTIPLTGLTTGCYRVQLEAENKTFITGCQYISSTAISNTILLQYSNSRFFKDVIFETGDVFQLRQHGYFGFLEKPRKDEAYRDEKYNPTILNSRSSKQWPVYFGNEYGLPDDIINIIDEIWSCDNVLIDNRPFVIADGSKPEFITAESEGVYPKRGMKLTVEAGVNENSRIYSY